MNHKALKLGTVLAGLVATSIATATTTWSAQDYDLYSGDFNGDNKTDILYIAKDPSMSSGIATSDASGAPNTSLQSWGSNHLGIPWHGSLYIAVVGDFNGDGRDDIILQPRTAGDSFILLAAYSGRIDAISQTIPNNCRGISWSADQHKIIAGNFSGRVSPYWGNHPIDDIFLQATNSTGVNAVVLTHTPTAANDPASGHIDGCGSQMPDQSWSDVSWSAFKWSTKNSVINVGDFNGDNKADLLVQAKPNIVMIDYEIPIPVPVYPPNSFGVVLSQGGSSPLQQAGVQQWSRNANGVDWSPNSATPIIGDFDGDGRADVLLQAKSSGKSSYLLTGNASGAAFSSGTAISSNVTLSADGARLIAGNFDGSGGAGIYVQALTPSGTNYLANTVGASITASANTPFSAAGTITSAIVGRTPGTFGVSPTGSATYTIPLRLAPSSSGAVHNAPILTLVYNGQQERTTKDFSKETDLLGRGWVLSGISSAITRCNATFAQNGAAAGVLLTSDDKFCIGGRQLRLLTGTYGSNGSTYATELEGFASITANGVLGDGPSQFTVKTRDGMTYTYTSTSTTTARFWSLSAFDGYTVLNGDPSAEPNILYLSSTQGIAAKFTRFPGGTYSGLMDSVTMFDKDGAIARVYKFDYAASPVTQLWRLAAITECADAAYTTCLQPTTISYQDGQAGLASPSLNAGTGSINGGHVFRADVDGDGKSDIVFANNGYWWVSRAAGGSPINTGAEFGIGEVVLDDFLASGESQLLVPVSGVWHAFRWNGSAFSSASTGLAASSFPYQYHENLSPTKRYSSADVNGDGLPDLVWIDGDTSVYTRHNTSAGGNVSFSATAVQAGVQPVGSGGTAGFQGRYASNRARIDVNGDGRDDAIVAKTEMVCYNQGTFEEFCVPHFYISTLTSLPGGLFSAGEWIDAGDFSPSDVIPIAWNRDACTDLAFNNGIVRVSACDGLAGQDITVFPAYTQYPIAALDWESDGFQDLLVNNGGVLYRYRSAGDGGAQSGVSTGILAPNSATWLVLDYDGDGLDDIAMSDPANNFAVKVGLHNGAGVHPDIVKTIADGYGVNVTFDYVSTAQSASNYSRTWSGIPAATYPLKDVTRPRYVVSRVTASDGIGGTYEQSFMYGAARENVQGRGFAGFAAIRDFDSRKQLYGVTTFRQDFPYIGMIANTKVYRSDLSTLVSSTTNTPSEIALNGTAGNQRTFPYVSQSTTLSYEVDGPKNAQLISTSTASFQYDNYGNLTQSTVLVTDNDGGSPFQDKSWRTVTVNTPDIPSQTAEWCFIPEETTVTTTLLPTGGSQTQTMSYDIDYEKCRLNNEVVEPNDSYLKATTVYGYNTNGNITSVQVIGKDSAGVDFSRTTLMGYGTTYIAPESFTNALEQSSTIGYNYKFGVKNSETSANGLTISWGHNAFGRVTSESHPDGATEWIYGACTASNAFCGTGIGQLRWGVEQIERDSNNTEIRRIKRYFDAFDRERRMASQTAFGVWTYVDTSYDALGRVETVRNPYSTIGTGYTRYTYDAIGRQTEVALIASGSTTPDRKTTIAYEGRTTKITDPKGSITQKITDVTGQLRRVIDPKPDGSPGPGGTTKYDYEFSNDNRITTITDAANNESTVTTNVRGFNIDIADVDLGHWEYKYNSLGELVWQKDAADQITTFLYDPLGRPYRRYDHGQPVPTQWNWGASAAAKNIGSLESVTSPGYAESYIYDVKGRVQTVTYDYGSDGNFSFDYTYNDAGQLGTLTYPETTPGNRLTLEYLYNYGRLTQIRKYGGLPFWTLNATNESSAPTDESLGNGVRVITGIDPLTGVVTSKQSGNNSSTTNLQNLAYAWDKNGNLLHRQALNQGLTETFSYDALDRVTASTVTGQATVTQTYDAIGNITNKSDINNNSTWTYHSTKKHAVTDTGGISYGYDDNGNMTSRNGSVIDWTTYNYPSIINSGSNFSQFFYGANRNRYKQTANYSGTTETTIYIGGLMEKVIVPTGTGYRHYIPAGSSVALYTRWDTGVVQTAYITADQISSTSSITGDGGVPIVNESFEAFGKRRDASDWNGLPSAPDLAAIGNTTRQGFTGHEHLDNLGLIHMNGRVYDPNIGRFISPDPLIDGGLGTQGLNRYGYVGNNPLARLDPSGFTCQLTPIGTGGNSEVEATGQVIVWGMRNELPCYSNTPYFNFSNHGVTSGNVAGEKAASNEQLAEVVVTAHPFPTEADFRFMVADMRAKFGLLRASVFGRNPSPSTQIVADFLDPITPSLDAASSALDGNYLDAVIVTGTALIRPLKAARGTTRATTDFIDNVTVVSRGKVIGRGTVDVRATVEGIQSGKLSPRDTFRNDQGLLPPQRAGYYQEFYHPTPGFKGTGPERIIRGQGGELYYTPDHYGSFIPLN